MMLLALDLGMNSRTMFRACPLIGSPSKWGITRSMNLSRRSAFSAASAFSIVSLIDFNWAIKALAVSVNGTSWTSISRLRTSNAANLE